MAGTSTSEDALAEWTAAQAIRFELEDGRPVRVGEERQAAYRSELVSRMAFEVLGDGGKVQRWLSTPSADLGGLAPAVLVADGHEGTQVVLRGLVRRHRRTLDARDG